MKTLHAFITAVLVLSASSSNLYAYETEWEDPKFTETKEKPEPSEQTDETRSDQPPEEKKNLPEDKALNSTFKVTGNIWSSYEFLDRSVNGVPDKAGSDKAGFKVGRARVNFRGKVNKGFAKGYAYRITVDTARAAALGDGCESPTGCKEHNDYLFYIKDAYTNIPLPISFGKNNLRIGQQHTPIVENQTQYNQVRSWGHRYLDSAGKAVWDETGLGASRDVGISLIHKNTYYSVHVMLANGEGYHKPNAEGLDISGNNVKLEDMAVGKSGASYGYDVYGMLVATPTGKNKDFIVNIGLPFRYHNIVGIDQSEYSRTTADFTDLNAPKYNYYRGDKRALQDITYGLEGEVVINRNDFSVTAGAGAAVKLDKAGYAFKFDDTVWFGVYPGDFQAISDHYAVEEDRYGYMNYVFLHTKFRKFGAFARLIQGSSGSKLNGKLGTRQTNKNWLSKMINSDVQDGEVGNLRLEELKNLDNVNAVFQTVAYGIEYFANDRFKVALGTRSIKGIDDYGKDFRQNGMEKVESINPDYKNAAEQIEDMKNPQYQQFWTSIGYDQNDSPDLNDWIGKKRIDREIFIRAEYTF